MKHTAAEDRAAIDHHEMPCDPVWLATITGSVLALVLVRSAAKKYSFQHRTTERMKAATMPGITVPPCASTTTAPAGTATSAPTAAILPARTSRLPCSIGGPSMVTMRALTM